MIPDAFKKRYSELADDSGFFACLETILPKSFRTNTIKSSSLEIRERFAGYGIAIKQMPWYGDAFVSQTPEIGATLEHFLGKIYIQELVSMIPALVVKKELENASLVLDACAAPGSKTTQIAAMMKNRGRLIANDLSYSRIKALQFNLQKAGALNTIITNQDLRFFPNQQYDVVILDAPCSSEGIMRKNDKLFRTWNEKKIYGHSRLQKQLIVKAFDLLREGGVMTYSTCTFAPEENEEVVGHLLSERNAKIEKIQLPGFKLSKGTTEWRKNQYPPEVENCVRIWPQHNDTGGFFVAMVVK
ncbi:RsmB/NOP family class I SAM-dependent RNA methyltransferase [Candidatus Micrarchaeota archaeon]|nr:RsmB/NOP family class I SAM-dependent RNA methyltransferase [Candidatus Micrarchaeota archaeon]